MSINEFSKSRLLSTQMEPSIVNFWSGLDTLKGEVSSSFIAAPPRRNSPPSFMQEDETDSGGSAPLLMSNSDQQLFSDMFQLVFQVYLDSVWDQ